MARMTSGGSMIEVGVDLEAGVGEVIADTDGEVALRPILVELVQHRQDHGRA